MSLFGAILKQGAKYADNLFDDAAMQAKSGTKWVNDNPNFNEKKYLELYPRPFADIPASERTPEQQTAFSTHMSALRRDARRAGTDGYDELGKPIPKYPNFNEERWLELNPRPEGHYSEQPVKTWNAFLHRARNNSNMDGFDELGEKVPEKPRWIGEFDYPSWLKQDPEPPSRLGAPDRHHGGRPNPERARWILRKKRAEQRAHNEGYDSIGRKIEPETTINKKYTQHEIRKLRDMPWSDQQELLDIKKFKKDLEADSGIEMEMDHAAPLLGYRVSGLNVPTNIQVVPKDWNRGKNSDHRPELDSFQDSLLGTLNRGVDRSIHLAENADDIAYRTREKAKLAKGFSLQLNRDILSPHTKLGKEARALWGDDAEKYLDYYRNQNNLLGIPSK